MWMGTRDREERTPIKMAIHRYCGQLAGNTAGGFHEMCFSGHCQRGRGNGVLTPTLLPWVGCAPEMDINSLAAGSL